MARPDDIRIKRFLNPGERVIWSGKPVLSKYLTSRIGGSIPGLVYALFAVIWISLAGSDVHLLRFSGSAIASGEPNPFDQILSIHPSFPLIFTLLGVLLFLYGVYRGVGVYAISWLEWRRMRYAITSRKVIILEGAFGRAAITIPLSEISSIEAVNRGPNIADLILGTLYAEGKGRRHLRGSSSNRRYYGPAGPTLIGVCDATGVRDVLDEAVKKERL